MLWRCGCDLDGDSAHLGECCPVCLEAERAGEPTPAADGFCCCRDERRQGLRHENTDDDGVSAEF